MDHQQNVDQESSTEIEIPSYFLCPISMEMMKDPVTVSTGITYDRENIEQWIRTAATRPQTCPVTKQPLTTTDDEHDLTPNHTLRRLIQYWCTLNASHGIERIPTPKPPISKSYLNKLISRATRHPSQTLSSLKELRSITLQSLANRRILRQATGAFDFLTSVIIDSHDDTSVDLALTILHHLHHNTSETETTTTTNLHHNQFPFFIQSLTKVLTRPTTTDESRTFALHFLKHTLTQADPRQLSNLKPEFFTAIVNVLTDTQHMSLTSQKQALHLLIHTTPWGRNRIAAVEAKAVWALLNILIDGPSKHSSNTHRPGRRISEMVLVILDQLCGCAEGRADLLTHGGGLAVVSKKILRVSHMATERAVKILSSIARFSGSNPSVVKEMLEVGVVAKLCLLMQVEFYDVKIQEICREILRLHSRVWKDHVCVPSTLRGSYPSC